MDKNENLKNHIYPELLPNWDSSPRSGKTALILTNSTPEKFRIHIKNIFGLVRNRPQQHSIVFYKIVE